MLLLGDGKGDNHYYLIPIRALTGNDPPTGLGADKGCAEAI
ncbi:MAG: hypothetical protein V4754_06490 [Pseudomonadota bacterium]